MKNFLIFSANFLSSATPPTRFFSWLQYIQSQNGKRKDYILSLLAAHPDGLTCKEIHHISGIYIHSLTLPLNELVKAGLIRVTGNRKCAESKRLVSVYSLSNHVQNT